jgi:phage anti-repressor protein
MDTAKVIESIDNLVGIHETISDTRGLELLVDIARAIRLLKKAQISRLEEWQFLQLEARIAQQIAKVEATKAMITSAT